MRVGEQKHDRKVGHPSDRSSDWLLTRSPSSMSVFISKALALLLQPLVAALVLGAVGGVLRVRWRRTAWFCWGLAVVVLVVPALPIVAEALQGHLERQYPPAAVEAAPTADAIVVLGGGVGAAIPPRVYPDLYDAADRVVHAARLYHAGKAPRIIVSGGFLRWREQARPEAEGMMELLIALGMPSEAIVAEPNSQTTYENARNTAALLDANGWDDVLLVTSAMHMRRALATFRAAGVDAHPVATDYGVVDSGEALLFRLVPSADALAASTRAIKEYAGYAVYCWRGWLAPDA